MEHDKQADQPRQHPRDARRPRMDATVVLAALRLAYRREPNQSLQGVMFLIEKDDHISQVTG